jgi:hypothetical protein
MPRTSNNAGAQPPANPADEAVKTEAPDTGVTPPQGGTASANEGNPPANPENGNIGGSLQNTDPASQNEEKGEGDKSGNPQDSENTGGKTDKPPKVPGPEDKVKVKHDGLKGAKITLPNGDIAAFDENGILEVDGKTAEYLLSIPGYEKG